MMSYYHVVFNEYYSFIIFLVYIQRAFAQLLWNMTRVRYAKLIHRNACTQLPKDSNVADCCDVVAFVEIHLMTLNVLISAANCLRRLRYYLHLRNFQIVWMSWFRLWKTSLLNLGARRGKQSNGGILSVIDVPADRLHRFCKEKQIAKE